MTVRGAGGLHTGPVRAAAATGQESNAPAGEACSQSGTRPPLVSAPEPAIPAGSTWSRTLRRTLPCRHCTGCSGVYVAASSWCWPSLQRPTVFATGDRACHARSCRVGNACFRCLLCGVHPVATNGDACMSAYRTAWDPMLRRTLYSSTRRHLTDRLGLACSSVQRLGCTASDERKGGWDPEQT